MLKNIFSKIGSIIIIVCAMSSESLAENSHFTVRGNMNDDARNNVAARLQGLSTSKSFSFQNNETTKNRIINETKEALKPFGYFHPQISIGPLSQTKPVIVNIAPGPATLIEMINIKISGPGANEPSLQNYLQHFPLKTGDVLNTAEYEKAKEKIFALANAAGYIKGYFQTNKIEIDVNKNTANVILNFDTRKRFYIGKITLLNNPYRDDFVKRMISVQEGQPFSSENILVLQQSLMNSYYFEKVLVIPDLKNNKDQKVPLNIDLAAPKAKKFSLGLGYGTLTGPRLTAGMKLQHLTDTGQHFEAQMKLSSVLSGLAAKYFIPGNNPLTEQWVLGVDAQQFNPENGKSKSLTLQGGYTKTEADLELKTFLNYLVEHYQFEDEKSRVSRLLYPDFSVTYTKVDDRMNASKGFSVNFDVKAASQGVVSSTSFLQGLISAKYLMSPTELSRLLFKASLGYTLVKDNDELPLSMFFFAGGTNSIRGYKDSSIGPGRYLELGSVEYRHIIKGNWTGAVFYDVGKATDKLQSTLYQSVGAGIIYNSLIGPVRFYIAHPLVKPQKSYSIEFSIGPEF